jgi:nucleotide-binding universal stress UspA family protein
MFSRIVVPLDRTECATAVLPAARALAARTGATLALLHVIDRHYPGTDLADQARRDARRWLRDLAQESEHSYRPPTIVAVRDGSPAEEILTYADEIEADLICMTTHGRAGLERMIVGSVAEQVLHRARLPLLLIRPGATVPDIAAHTPIVVPLDGSPRAEAALPHAVNMAKMLDAPLTLVRVWNTALPFMPDPYAVAMDQQLFEEWEEATKKSVAAYLTSVAEQLTKQITVRTVILHGDAVQQLTLYLHGQRSGLVVMGTPGRGGVPRWVMGSVAIALVRATMTPIMLIGDACVHTAGRTAVPLESINTR